MKSLRKKTTATLLTAIFMISMLAVTVSAFPSEYDIFQPDPDSGTVEWSMAQAYSGDYSAYLQVNYPSNPPGCTLYTSDSNEVYVIPYTDGNDLVPQLLDNLDSFSFYYYRPSSTVGGASEIPPQVDIWLATGGIGEAEDEWLLGQIDLATAHDTWVEVPLSAITWIKAMGGTIYGTGSAGLEAAKIALSGSEILGFGVQVGSPATRDNSRTEEAKYYIDDIEINGVVYDFENVGEGPVTLIGDARHPTVSISVDPTSIDFSASELVLGESYDLNAWDITVTNTGETKVDVTTELMDDDGFYAASLRLDAALVVDWHIDDLAKAGSYKVDLSLVIPRDEDPGEHAAVLVFWAEEYIAP